MPVFSADRAEVLRYLGYDRQALEPSLEALLRATIDECEQLARPRYSYAVFPRGERGIQTGATELPLPGQDIARHLGTADRCVVLAATLGMEVEQRLRQLQSSRLTQALIFDAACNALIETVMDRCQAEAAASAPAAGFIIGPRYSPGYGDLPLTLQAPLLRLLDAQRRLGLTVTANNLLLPRKSVTALAGLFTPQQSIPRRRPACSDCELAAHCQFRKGGRYCEP